MEEEANDERRDCLIYSRDEGSIREKKNKSLMEKRKRMPQKYL